MLRTLATWAIETSWRTKGCVLIGLAHVPLYHGIIIAHEPTRDSMRAWTRLKCLGLTLYCASVWPVFDTTIAASLAYKIEWPWPITLEREHDSAHGHHL